MKSLQFNLESLEDRRMMAGDVSVDVTNSGDLVMEGDDFGNEVVIRALSGEGAYQIQGLNGTTINGAGTQLVTDVTDDFRIDLEGGDNKLMLTGYSGNGGVSNPFRVADNLDIRTGDGDNILMINADEIGGDVRVRTGDGNDTVGFVDTAVSGRSRISTSDGNDSVVFQEASVGGRSDINLGSDDDVFVSYDSAWSDRIRVRGSSGDDHLAMARSQFDARSDFDGGSDTDTVWDGVDDEANVYADARYRNVELSTEIANLGDVVELNNTIVTLNPGFADAQQFFNEQAE